MVMEIIKTTPMLGSHMLITIATVLLIHILMGDSQNKWKPATTLPTSDYTEKQHELNKSFHEQVASHTSMIEDLSKSISSISTDIKGLKLQTVGLDKALSKLAYNQATLLSMFVGKPHVPPVVGMKSIVVSESLPTIFEETYNELLNYKIFLSHFCCNSNPLKKKKRKPLK
jgi:hypothetical protein